MRVQEASCPHGDSRAKCYKKESPGRTAQAQAACLQGSGEARPLPLGGTRAAVGPGRAPVPIQGSF